MGSLGFTELKIILIIPVFVICLILSFILCLCFETTITEICFSNFGDITALTKNSTYFYIKFKWRLVTSINMIAVSLIDCSYFSIRNTVM